MCVCVCVCVCFPGKCYYYFLIERLHGEDVLKGNGYCHYFIEKGNFIFKLIFIDSCCTTLCWFPLYSKVNQLYIY